MITRTNASPFAAASCLGSLRVPLAFGSITKPRDLRMLHYFATSSLILTTIRDTMPSSQYRWWMCKEDVRLHELWIVRPASAPSLASGIKNQYRDPNICIFHGPRKTTRPPVPYPNSRERQSAKDRARKTEKDRQDARSPGSPPTSSHSTHHQPDRCTPPRHHGDLAYHLRAPAVPDLR